jgi:hypothetical protein
LRIHRTDRIEDRQPDIGLALVHEIYTVAREVTLLPRHWDWLAKQPGGASVASRKLVDDARRANGQRDARRAAHERARFVKLIVGWPDDVRDHVFALGFGDARFDASRSTHSL